LFIGSTYLWAKLIKLGRFIGILCLILAISGCSSRIEYCSKDPEVNWGIMTLYNWEGNPLDESAFYSPTEKIQWTPDSLGLMESISHELALQNRNLIDEGRGHILELKLLRSEESEPEYQEKFSGAIAWNKIPKNTWVLDVRLNMGRKLVLRTFAEPIESKENLETGLKLRARNLCSCFKDSQH
jgi:hypothetical protein